MCSSLLVYRRAGSAREGLHVFGHMDLPRTSLTVHMMGGEWWCRMQQQGQEVQL